MEQSTPACCLCTHLVMFLQPIVQDRSRQVLCHSLAPFIIANLFYWYWFLIYLVLVVTFRSFYFVFIVMRCSLYYDGVSGHQALPFLINFDLI